MMIAWQMLTRASDPSEAMLVEHKTLIDLAHLPPGWSAWREHKVLLGYAKASQNWTSTETAASSQNRRFVDKIQSTRGSTFSPIRVAPVASRTSRHVYGRRSLIQ